MQIPIASVLTVILSATVVHAISAEDLASHVKEITDGIAVGVETLKQMGKTDHGDFFSTMPVIVRNFKDISNKIRAAAADIRDGDDGDVTGAADHFDLCDVSTELVDTWNGFVNIFIGKEGILSAIPANIFTAPIAGHLKSFSDGVNNFSTSFMRMVPGCKDARQKIDLRALSKKFEASLDEFEESAFPPARDHFRLLKGLFDKERGAGSRLFGEKGLGGL